MLYNVVLMRRHRMSNSGGGIGMVGLAWIALVVLKVLGYLNWHWLAVLFFPIWFPMLLALGIPAFIILLALGIIAFIILVVMALGLFVGIIALILAICGVELN